MRHRATTAVRHARRRGNFGDPPSQPRVPLGAREGGEHNGGNLVAGDLADGELSPVNLHPLFLFH